MLCVWGEFLFDRFSKSFTKNTPYWAASYRPAPSICQQCNIPCSTHPTFISWWKMWHRMDDFTEETAEERFQNYGFTRQLWRLLSLITSFVSCFLFGNSEANWPTFWVKECWLLNFKPLPADTKDSIFSWLVMTTPAFEKLKFNKSPPFCHIFSFNLEKFWF